MESEQLLDLIKSKNKDLVQYIIIENIHLNRNVLIESDYSGINDVNIFEHGERYNYKGMSGDEVTFFEFC